MTTRFFQTILILFFFLQISCNNNELKRPNILWIVAEDLSPDLPTYGDFTASTPNIDLLAAQGVRYTSVFASAPVCSASRSAMITGCYQTAIGAHNHRTLSEEKMELPESVYPVTKYFNDAGYYTILASAGEKDKNKIPAWYGSGKTDFNFVFNQKEAFDGHTWKDCPESQPFFAQLSLKQTHRGTWWHVGEKRENTTVEKQIKIPPYYPDDSISHEVFSAYYDAIQIVDRQIGEIIEELKKDGRYENTVIIFTSDHGRPMPRGKQFLYDMGTHVPFIIYGPDIKKGKVDERLISSLDVTASMLAIAGIDVPESMHGKDFIMDQSFSRDFVISARDRCDETVHRMRSVRSNKYKYIRNFYTENPYTAQNRYKDTNYPILGQLRKLQKTNQLDPVQLLFMAPTKPKEELYDLENDPFEINNLAGNQEYKTVLEEHRAELEAWLKRYPDLGAKRESEEVMKKIMVERVKKYGY